MKDLPKCVEALRRLSKSCPLVGVKMEDTGNHVVAACGNEHIRVLRRDLEEEYAADVPLTWGVPSVTYKETITEKSSKVSLSKSPNKHNRLFVTAEPCSNEFCQAVEGMRIWEQQDQKERAKILVDELGWEKNDALKKELAELELKVSEHSESLAAAQARGSPAHDSRSRQYRRGG